VPLGILQILKRSVPPGQPIAHLPSLFQVSLPGHRHDTVMAEDDPPRIVSAGARVRDRFCGEVHTLRRPDRAVSDALLVYECSVRHLDSRGAPAVFQATHIGAILGRLVGGFERVELPSNG
jgi:hypothetical protein